MGDRRVGAVPQDEGAVFTEAIDTRLGRIGARGRLTLQAADMVRGTVEALQRDGHARILLDLQRVHAVDDAGLSAIHSLRDRISAAGGHLAVIDARIPVGPPS